VSDSSMPPPNKKDLDDIGIAIFSVLFAAGFGGIYVGYLFLGIVLGLIGAVGFLLMISRRGYRLTKIHTLIVSNAVFVVACGFLAYLLWAKSNELESVNQYYENMIVIAKERLVKIQSEVDKNIALGDTMNKIIDDLMNKNRAQQLQKPELPSTRP